MYVICTDNTGFEDMLSGPEMVNGELTNGSAYMVENVGVNSYQIYDDKEVLRWFGDVHFTLIDEPVKE